MVELLNFVSDNPWTSFFTFLMLHVLLSMILKVCEVIFLNKKQK